MISIDPKKCAHDLVLLAYRLAHGRNEIAFALLLNAMVDLIQSAQFSEKFSLRNIASALRGLADAMSDHGIDAPAERCKHCSRAEHAIDDAARYADHGGMIDGPIE